MSCSVKCFLFDTRPNAFNIRWNVLLKATGIYIQLNSRNPNSYNSNNHVIRTNFPVPSNFPIMYGNFYNSNKFLGPLRIRIT